MKVNLSYIKVFAITTLSVIIFSQCIWIYNMYISYEYELALSIDKSLENAVFMEASDRGEQLGGFISFDPKLAEDAGRFVQKKITTADTSFYVQIDRYDPHSTSRILQFLLKDDFPLDVDKLNTIFKEELSVNGKFPVQETYIEYIDLKTGAILARSNNNQQSLTTISSKVFPIDVFDSLGVKAYVESSMFTILGMMTLQLILSIVLIIISVSCLIYLTQIIYVQKKEERMRQNAINAMIHEFKRPISSAVAQIALIPYYLDKDNKEKIYIYAENTLLELNKLTAYTERIQQISNNENKSIYLNRVPIEINPFFELLKEKYICLDEPKTVGFNLDIQSAKQYMNVDLLHFSNVMDNLVENAIKYSKSHVDINIRVSDSDERLIISVKDNGIGISKIEQKYIFDKFYRSRDKLAQNKSGFGLGLTYTKSIVETHGGSIKVISELNHGSEFTIYLPIK